MLSAAFIVLTLLGVGVTSRHALLSVLLDGLPAAMTVVPAILAGLWLVPLFRPGAMPIRWHLLLGAVLGLGVLSLLVLLLGLAGLLQRTLWVVLLAAFAVAGVIRLRMLTGPGAGHDDKPVETEAGTLSAFRYLWLLGSAFLVLALLAASNPPGLVWAEEGFGYDVLEYHLQMPKEYFLTGRIEYAPHNVYANFPANVEMLYLLAMTVFDDVYDIGVVANMIHLILAVLTVFAAWVAGREWSPRAGVVCGVVTATTGWLAYLCGLAYVENGMLLFGMAATAVLIRLVRTGGGGGEHDTTKAKAGMTAAPLRSPALAGVIAGFACGCKYTALPIIAAPLGFAVLLLPGRSMGRRIAALFVFGTATLLTFSPWLIKNQMMTGNPVFPLMNGVVQASPPGWGAYETEQWDLGHGMSLDEQTASARFGALWKHVLGDKYQRFGPIVFLLAVFGLLGRRRDRTDLMLLAVVIIQLAVWLLATHLFARFAVVLLIPLALLCGRAATGAVSVLRLRVIVIALLCGGVWNFTFAARLNAQESLAGTPASLIYDGLHPDCEYLRVVNHELPTNAKILLIGEARAFYFKRDVDYCVAFNRNTFFEAVRAARDDEDLLRWLRGRGYTHVLVNWSEVRRLASTYGFSPAVDSKALENLFDRLSKTGLAQLREFPHPRTGGLHVELYTLPP